MIEDKIIQLSRDDRRTIALTESGKVYFLADCGTSGPQFRYMWKKMIGSPNLDNTML